MGKRWLFSLDEVKQLFPKEMQLYIFCQDTVCQLLDLG